MRNILFFIYLSFSAILVGFADTTTDSLDLVIAKLPVERKLEKLNELASDKSSSFKYYANQLLEEAELAKNEMYKGNALFQIVRYYYSRNIDSMSFFMRKAEPIFFRHKRYEDLFRMRGWYIYALSNTGENDSVLSAVEAMKALSVKLDYPEGVTMANQALANFYCSTGLMKEGVALFEDILQEMEEQEAPLAKQVTIIRQLLNRDLDMAKRLFYLKKLEGHIEKCEATGMDMLDVDNPLYYVKYLYHRSYVVYGVDKEDLSLIASHLAEAERLVKENNIRNENLTLSNLRLLYYRTAKDYQRGVTLADELIDYSLRRNRKVSMLTMLMNKAIICYETGHGMEAAKAYKEYISIKDSVTNAEFYKDLADLRTRHDLDKLELANKKMELEAVHAHAKLLLMGGGVSLLLLICCSLGYISYSRHKYGLKLEKAKAKAEESDRLKSAFLANMNHEIRTPLNAIVGFSQVLIEEEDKENRQEFADIIQNNNELLQRLIGDVLDLSRIESNTMSLIYRKQDIPSLMKEIYNMIQIRMPDGVELLLDDCEELVMETDRNRLTQILTNLLTNAMKHTEKGFIRFGYKKTSAAIKFFVQDSGVGISEDKVGSIFSRFVKLDDWSTGVGLGLAICRGLVEQMNGKIWVTSKLGEGSSFFVEFPSNNKDSIKNK